MICQTNDSQVTENVLNCKKIKKYQTKLEMTDFQMWCVWESGRAEDGDISFVLLAVSVYVSNIKSFFLFFSGSQMNDRDEMMLIENQCK